ncbi:MAG: class I SAM-dependent methyltransferase, partial [Archaeoglobaceae archaeon]|nr:class I SAM-dependent methyltransferase [Archaeoglobaceae archaeon]
MKKMKKDVDRFVGKTPEILEDRHRKVLKIFSNYKFEKILDVGCGDGKFTKLIAEACRAKEVYGLEISEIGVEMAKRNGINCSKCDVDVENFPFDSNYFDAVFAGEIIEHLYDPDHFLEEVHRVLKPDGIFVLTTPNLASIHNRIALLLGYQPFPIGISLRLNVGRFY